MSVTGNCPVFVLLISPIWVHEVPDCYQLLGSKVFI